MKRRNDTAIGLAIAWAQQEPCCEDVAVIRGGNPRFIMLWVWDQDASELPEWASPVLVDRGETA